MYAQMLRIRRFAEQVNEHLLSNPGSRGIRLRTGQEAIAVGVCSALRRIDCVVSNNQNHAHCLAKGAPVDRLLEQMIDTARRGTGLGSGPVNLANFEEGILGVEDEVSSAALATGSAFLARARTTGQVAVAFYRSDTPSDEFDHAMRVAVQHALPVVYVCERAATQSTADPKPRSTREEALAMPNTDVEGYRVRVVHAAAQRAIDHAREGGGPSLLVCRVAPCEPGDAIEDDPIDMHAGWLLEQAIASQGVLQRLVVENELMISSAVERALALSKSP